MNSMDQERIAEIERLLKIALGERRPYLYFLFRASTSEIGALSWIPPANRDHGAETRDQPDIV
jgi:hypothetical protein